MFLRVEQLKKQYGLEPVLHGLDLFLEARHTLSILGRSGSGKTTLLKLIAGLEDPDAGMIQLDGQDVTGLSPQERGIVYLYQEPLLFPHLNVFENLAFGLRLRHLGEDAVHHRVGEMLESLGLQEHARKRPYQLSGGQRQRVAFGRAIIINPPLLLLDEPFGSLDSEIRADMQQLFKHLAAAYQITTVFVTHDLKEAMLMGDRLAVLRAGTLVTYPSLEAFIDDPETGVARELLFWEGLRPSSL